MNNIAQVTADDGTKMDKDSLLELSQAMDAAQNESFTIINALLNYKHGKGIIKRAANVAMIAKEAIDLKEKVDINNLKKGLEQKSLLCIRHLLDMDTMCSGKPWLVEYLAEHDVLALAMENVLSPWATGIACCIQDPTK